MKKNKKEDNSIASYDNRMYFLRNLEGLEYENVESYETEYEVLTDGYTVGECTFGPYYLTIWEISYKKDGEERKLCLRIREKKRSENDRPWENADKEAFYHGGDIVDEILALSSLFLRRRFKRGPQVRWNDKPQLFLKPEEWIDKSLISGKRKLTEIPQWLELVKGLDNNLHQKFILAVRLYYQAILLIEEQPDLAYLNLVSSIEALCREQDIGVVGLADLDSGLAALVKRIKNINLEKRIEHAILRREKFICRRFREFIIENIEDEFWNSEDRPELGKIKPEDLRELLTRIYNQRSKMLHEGQPFPLQVSKPPLMAAEIDFSLGISIGGKRWEPKDYIPYPHFFESLVNHVLKTYLKRNQKKNKAKK